MRVVWTPVAEYHRAEIYDYIAADNPHAAGRMSILFDNAAESLVIFPERGRPGDLPGTRELILHKHYRLVYEVDNTANTIWILALVHGARQWPPPHP